MANTRPPLTAAAKKQLIEVAKTVVQNPRQAKARIDKLSNEQLLATIPIIHLKDALNKINIDSDKLSYYDGYNENKDFTVLDIAIFSGQLDLAELILNKIVSLKLAFETDGSAKMLFTAIRNFRPKANEDNYEVNFFKLINTYLEFTRANKEVYQSDPLQQTPGSMTALGIAIEGKHFRLASFLLAKGANIDEVVNLRTYLSAACKSGDIKLIQWLVDHKTNVDARNGLGETPLTTVINSTLDEEIQSGVLKLLLKSEANPNQLNTNHRSPLSLAIEHMNFTAVKLLLKAGADPNFSNVEQMPPLLNAVKNKSLDLVKLLITFKADVDGGAKVNSVYPSPLYIACQEKLPSIVWCLLQIRSDFYMIRT